MTSWRFNRPDHRGIEYLRVNQRAFFTEALKCVRYRARQTLLPYFKPTRSALVPGIGRYLLLRPFAFEVWFRGRAAWFLLMRRWSQPEDSVGAEAWNSGHRSRVIDHNFGHRWLFSRRRTEKVMSILRCIGQVSPESRILCIGPRNEAEILLLSLHGFKLKNITGIDLFTYSPLIRQMDMHNLEFSDNSFDIVYVLYTLPYADDLPKACREIIRVLKDNGIIAAGFQHTSKMTDLRTKGSELRDGLSELFHLFHPHIRHVYWQEAEAARDSSGDYLATAIFDVKKQSAHSIEKRSKAPPE